VDFLLGQARGGHGGCYGGVGRLDWRGGAGGGGGGDISRGLGLGLLGGGEVGGEG
jgi:hypothetical protein